jgi:uncharacterized protein DUF4440
MNKTVLLAGIFFCVAASCSWGSTPDTPGTGGPTTAPLLPIVLRLDTELFDSFNACSTPGELEKHAKLLDAKLEFYHDKGGVTWTRDAYLAKTRENVCGKYRRVLTAGTVEVSPIDGFGAIEEGRHVFCEIKSGKCFGSAKFLIVWHKSDDGWKATRIFSYEHKAMD